MLVKILESHLPAQPHSTLYANISSKSLPRSEFFNFGLTTSENRELHFLSRTLTALLGYEYGIAFEEAVVG